MRSFVLLGSMLQSSSLVKADCTLQDGTVQIGARKFSEISPRNIPYHQIFPQSHPKINYSYLPSNQPQILPQHRTITPD